MASLGEIQLVHSARHAAVWQFPRLPAARTGFIVRAQPKMGMFPVHAIVRLTLNEMVSTQISTPLVEPIVTF